MLPEVPPGLENLYAELASPPRLVAHLWLVHDVPHAVVGDVGRRG